LKIGQKQQERQILSDGKGERIRNEKEGVMEFNPSRSNAPDFHRSNLRIYGWI
jgi:hypothetical protein